MITGVFTGNCIFVAMSGRGKLSLSDLGSSYADSESTNRTAAVNFIYALKNKLFVFDVTGLILHFASAC